MMSFHRGEAWKFERKLINDKMPCVWERENIESLGKDGLLAYWCPNRLATTS